MKNDCSSEFFEIKAEGGFFQKQSTDKIILGVGLFSNIGRISSVGRKSESGGVFKLS